jgi:4-hydroxybenzoate polyprenyltransferase
VIQSVGKYLSLVKFSHTIFALPFAVIGFMLAINQQPEAFSEILAVKVLLLHGVCPYSGHGLQPMDRPEVLMRKIHEQ